MIQFDLAMIIIACYLYFYFVVTLQTFLDHLNTNLVLHSDPHSITFLQQTTHSTRLDKTMVKFDLAMITIACFPGAHITL